MTNDRDIILSVSDLSISIPKEKGITTLIEDASFEIFEQEILGLRGESGAGKSITAKAIMGLLTTNFELNGRIQYYRNQESIDLLKLDEIGLSNIRGNEISIIFQEATQSLNPSQKCGKQILEAILIHSDLAKDQAKVRVFELLRQVQLDDPERIYNAYPHQISGGQAQRIMIAMAIANSPKLLIADEATSSLDTRTKYEIADLLKSLSASYGLSILFISHDLSLLRYISSRSLIVNQTNIKTFDLSKIGTGNKLLEPSRSTKIEPKEEYITFNNVTKTYDHKKFFLDFRKTKVYALRDASFTIHKKEILGIVGESGSGKSTIAKLLVKLEKEYEGSIRINNKEIREWPDRDKKWYKKNVQMIFQDPYSSLDPRMKIEKQLLMPMRVHKIGSTKADRLEKLKHLITAYDLPENTLERYPHSFSGGQLQRINIVRCLAIEPSILICDECISSLDSANKMEILGYLQDLNENKGMTILFISHNIEEVCMLSDQIIVLSEGHIVDRGHPTYIHSESSHSITQQLLITR